MYLTSHRIHPDEGNEAVNTFLHITGHPVDSPEREMELIDVRPGELVSAECEVSPGHNRVLCYVDIVANDQVSLGELQTLRDSAHTLLVKSPDLMPLFVKSGNAVLRFGCTIGHHQAKRHLTDFDVLWDHALRVYRDRPVPAWLSGKQALVITLQQIGEQLIYQLDDASQKRVQAIKGQHWPRSRFTMDVFDRMDFEFMLCDIMDSIITSITGLEKPRIVQMGGAKIVHQLTGRVIAQYP